MNDNLKQKRVTIVSIGGGAGKILRSISSIETASWLKLVHLDTDAEDEIISPNIHSHLITNEWVDGHGCGGDPVVGENSLRTSIREIKGLLKESDLLLVISCLGQGTGSGGVQVLSRLSKEEGILTFFFVTYPFAFEGNSKRDIAEQALATLRKDADVVIAIKNDLLFTYFSAESQVDRTFEQANKMMAKGVIGIGELVRCRGLISIDFQNLRSVLRRKDAFCSFGVGCASGENKLLEVVEDLFRSPMLGGPEFIDQADVIIATLVGGSEVTMGDMQQCLEEFNSKLNQASKTIIGANIVQEKKDELQISMLAIHYLKNNRRLSVKEIQKKRQKQHSPKRKRSNVDFPQGNSPYQPTLPFNDEGHSLGIFRDGPATIYNGQNLDIPTFQRLGIKLELPSN